MVVRCTLAVIDIPTQDWDTEGIVIDLENDTSIVPLMKEVRVIQVSWRFMTLYNLDNKECISGTRWRSCTGFRLCDR